MQNLSKYKIFTQVYDEMKLLDKIYIFETLQGPDLSKIKKFYGALCYLMIDLYCGELTWDGISSENDKYKRVIKLKEKYNLKKSNSNGVKEISFIYDAVNCLKFNELQILIIISTFWRITLKIKQENQRMNYYLIGKKDY